MGEGAEFQTLLTGFRAGDQLAAEELCRRYGPVIRAAVRRHLHERLRTQFDSLDFVQDVWVSFLTTPDRYMFETPHALCAFLTRVAHDKVIDAARRLHEARMGTGLGETAADRDRIAGDELPAPAPDQWAIAGEWWEQVLRGVPAGYRKIVERLRDGYTYDEIARMLGVSTRTIGRIVRTLKRYADL